ncbi:MAG TPA: type III pantothenate kinase [Vicinamibacterales bacterium]|jgi:type III pantothenate kinase
MILTLDVGNSQVFGGVFEAGDLTVRFRQASRPGTSSDELGLFLKSVLRENQRDPASVGQIAICSVVPELVYSLRSCCRKYFGIDPFILQAGVKTGLKLRYRNPIEVGPDRIANSIGATHLYPDRNLIIIDFGTATTFDVVRAGREHVGGIILPGLRIAMEALERNTARLPTVEIVPPSELVGRSTVESIQSGLYFGNRAMVKELTREIRQQAFGGEPAIVIGTGGFSRLFEGEHVFDALLPDLVLIGLERALRLNEGASRPWRAAEAGVL